ncbi:Hypothetical predicted protein [Xyrichtys novacula]|uniref:Uncharacterized protein n=1 Tax=Xyrichtys novacula TaxID=13765 RepID=A0AAV1F9M7_XYRNO|nr:Hypothetical predicted protein [Xyrichtys novacula]
MSSKCMFFSPLPLKQLRSPQFKTQSVSLLAEKAGTCSGVKHVLLHEAQAALFSCVRFAEGLQMATFENRKLDFGAENFMFSEIIYFHLLQVKKYSCPLVVCFPPTFDPEHCNIKHSSLT